MQNHTNHIEAPKVLRSFNVIPASLKNKMLLEHHVLTYKTINAVLCIN